MTNSKSKQRKRNRLWKKIPTLREAMRGSVVNIKRKCGKSYCHCQKGGKHLHHSLYISINVKGRTHMIYVPKKYEKKVIQQTGNYKKLQEVIKEIGQLNLELFKEKKKKGKKG